MLRRSEPMSPQQLILKRAAGRRPSGPSGKWNEDDYDVLAGDVVVGRIMKAIAAPVGSPWFWTLAFGYHRDRRPTHGYAATRASAKDAECCAGATPTQHKGRTGA